MKSFVKWCVAARQDARSITTILLLFQPVILKVLGLINRTKCAYPRRMLLLLLDATQVFTLAKGVRGRCPFPLCSLTIWYYRYALTLHIAKPDPAYAWHSELNMSLGTTTRNHDLEPTKSIRSSHRS